MKKKRTRKSIRAIGILLAGLVVLFSSMAAFFLLCPLGLYKPIASPYSVYYEETHPDFATPKGSINHDVVNILLLGVDKGTEAENNRTTMHQADVILLCSFNKKTGAFDILSVPRTITISAPHFDVFGEFAYEAEEPLCNVYALGKDENDAALMTVSAVQAVLGGVPIHGVVAAEWQMVKAIVDTFGGVTVNCFFDIAHFYGVGIEEPIILDGSASVEYIRARSLPGMDGSNETRNLRQMSFMAALYSQGAQKIKNNPFLIFKLYEVIKPYYTTTLSLRECSFMGFKLLREGKLLFHRTVGIEESEHLFVPDYEVLSQYIGEVCCLE